MESRSSRVGRARKRNYPPSRLTKASIASNIPGTRNFNLKEGLSELSQTQRKMHRKRITSDKVSCTAQNDPQPPSAGQDLGSAGVDQVSAVSDGRRRFAGAEVDRYIEDEEQNGLKDMDSLMGCLAPTTARHITIEDIAEPASSRSPTERLAETMFQELSRLALLTAFIRARAPDCDGMKFNMSEFDWVEFMNFVELNPRGSYMKHLMQSRWVFPALHDTARSIATGILGREIQSWNAQNISNVKLCVGKSIEHMRFLLSSSSSIFGDGTCLESLTMIIDVLRRAIQEQNAEDLKELQTLAPDITFAPKQTIGECPVAQPGYVRKCMELLQEAQLRKQYGDSSLLDMLLLHELPEKLWEVGWKAHLDAAYARGDVDAMRTYINDASAKLEQLKKDSDDAGLRRHWDHCLVGVEMYKMKLAKLEVSRAMLKNIDPDDSGGTQGLVDYKSHWNLPLSGLAKRVLHGWDIIGIMIGFAIYTSVAFVLCSVDKLWVY